MHPAIFVTIGSDAPRSPHFNPLPPLEGPHASYATYNYPSTPGATFALTNKSTPEAQVAAIKMLDSMFTIEGFVRAVFGEEGKDWRQPEEGDVALDENAKPIFAQIPRADGAPPANRGWGALGQYYNPKTSVDGWVQGTDIYADNGYERRLLQATNMYLPHQPENVFPHWAIWIDPAIADEAATMRTNITDYVNQNSLQFITGDKDLDTEWDDYVAGLEQLNLTRYLEIMQQAYDQLPK